ncbi:hypothetical protein [Fodinicola acaciae]|uniref:hypothetical protein n=1 Tax=Fodinicola acaciae TaxID=2681555 RepID=UPI0013D36B97|nr:hypothetical protein [Fodinicola acaciae]
MPDESLEQSFAKLQSIQNRYRGMLLGQERNDWCNRTASDLQKYVPWVWSQREQKWVQTTCMAALVMTDLDGSNEQRLITASGKRGRPPAELREIIEHYQFEQVPLDDEWIHAEVRGVSFVKRSGKQLQAIGAGFEVCNPCDDLIRAEGIKPATITKRQADALRSQRKRPGGLGPYDPPPRPSGGPKHGR